MAHSCRQDEDAKTIKLAEVMTKYTAAFAEIEKKYPTIEREGWAAQEAETNAYLADNSAETPVLSILVEQRGMGGL